MKASLPRAGVVSAALITVLLTTSCASSASPDGTGGGSGSISIGLAQPFTGFEFDTLTSVSDFQFAKEVIEPLVVPNDEGTDLRPAFAESYSYDDSGTVLTFEISEGATFSDGTPATSADVAFSYGLWSSGGNAPLLTAIASVEAPSPTQFVMHLSHPSSALLSVLSWASNGVVKEDFGGLTRDEYFADPIGTGPYVVGTWTPGIELVLESNPDYHGADKPIVDEIRLETVEDPNQRVLQFTAGQLDVVEYISSDQLPQFDPDVIQSVPAAEMTSIYFNTAAGPFADVNLRKAVSLAIDREALVESVYGGEATVATEMLPPQLPGSTKCESCDYPTRDLDAAAEYLAQSGYAGETLTLMVNSSTGRNLLAAQAIQSMLAEAGMTVTIEPADQSTLLDLVIAGGHEFVIGDYSSTSTTLIDPLSFYAQTDSYWTYIDGTQFLTSAGAIDLARTPEELSAAALEFEEWSYETMWATPIASVNSIFAVQPRVSGLFVTPVALYNLSSISVTD